MWAASASDLIPASAAPRGSGRGAGEPALTKSSATLGAGFAPWPAVLPATETAATRPRGTRKLSHRLTLREVAGPG